MDRQASKEKRYSHREEQQAGRMDQQTPEGRQVQRPGNRRKRQVLKSRQRKDIGRRRRTDGNRIMRYILLAVVLTSLVLGAFLGPQLVFRIQDGYLCQDTETSMRENMDISVMTTSYEPLLGRRLSDFAEGLALDTRYYVASQDFEVTKDLYDRLTDDDTGIHQELLYTFLDMGHLPYTIAAGFTVEQWKQYVIYSEDYAKGVNFILWYLKLQDVGGIGYEILMDAEYGNLYAIKSKGSVETSIYFEEAVNAATEKYGYASYWAEVWNDKSKWGIENRWGLWYNLSYLFESMNSELRDAVYISMQEEIPYLEITDDADQQFLTRMIQDDQLCMISDSGKALRIMLYYKEYPLCLDIKFLDEPQESNENQFYNGYPGMVMGLSDVYGLIPEFAEGDM